jgi:hypothetical protein
LDKVGFATASQIRIWTKWALRPRRKREFGKDGLCDRVANENLEKVYFATASQARFFSVFATLHE